ncbi:MAG: AI-2E family transporter [Desulfobacteraceae bacterium]|nr:AI-2E family transporter [Desulfobacteraceae bacterium]
MDTVVVRNKPLINLAAFVVVVAGLKSASVLVIPFLLAVFFSIICAPAFFWMQKKRIPSFLCVLILLVVVIAVQMLFVSLVSKSIADFSNNLPFYQDRLNLLTHSSLQWLSGFGVELKTDRIVQMVDPSRIFKLVANTLNGVGGVLTNAFLVFLTLIFILLEASGFPNKLRAILKNENENLDKYVQISNGVNRYLGIKTLTSLGTGAVIAIWLMIQGVDFPLMWGLLAFMLNYIPNIGSIIAAVPAVLLALVQLGPISAGITAIGFFIVNTLVGSIIEPKIMGEGIGLSALVVFLSLAFWGWALGPVGMLLSVPLTMAAKIALSSRESTKWLSILLGSNKEAALILARKNSPEK